MTQSVSVTPDSTTGQPTVVTVQPGAADTSQTIETDLTYDAFGNAKQADAKGCVWTSSTTCAATTRTTKNTYDTTTYHGAFATGATNALNQSQSATYDVRFGLPTGNTDLNGLNTTQSVDTLGRPTLVTKPDGTKIAIAYAYCSGVNGGSASCPTNGAYTVTSTPENSSGTQNGSKAIAYFDTLSRQIAQDTQAQDGSWIRVSVQYNANGQVQQTSRPYFVSGGTAKWSVSTYDAVGRVTQVTMPDNSHTTYGYHGLSTSVTNDKGQTTTTLHNAQGLAVAVHDAAGQTTTFAYDAIGDRTAVHDPAGNATTATYDARGRIATASDPDRGNWSYKYDSFGQLNVQTDAKGQVSILSYDALARVTARTEPGLTSSWTWDTATHGVGLVASTTTGSGFTQTETYDTLARSSTNTITIDGTNYTYTTAYNSDGQVDTVTYPSGFVAKYIYTLGYLTQIKDNGTGSSVWTANSFDAEQHLTSQTAGNGVSTTQVFDPNTGRVLQIRAGASDSVQNQSYNWDTIGNLTSRADTFQGYTETFTYDALNRLLTSQVGTSTAKTITYDASGNITKKSDICGTANCFTYGSGAGPHALTGITGTYNGVTNPTFTYDANGNLTAGGSRSYTWTSFNMVATITQGLVSEAFVYDSAHNRLKVCLPNCSSPTSTTFYLNNTSTGTMSEKVVSGSTTTWHDYVQAGGGIVAERFNTAGTITWRYFVLDHLGSTATLTDASGTVQERLSYDPWGRRRNADGSDNATCSITSATSRGFTGHEMIDAACMINMNARVYDPSLGRFASADDRPSGSGNGQDWNTYAYVNNGPLSATDPTGHTPQVIPPDPGLSCFDCSFTSVSGFGSTGAGIAYFGGCGSWNEGGNPETAVVACFDSWRVVGSNISPRDVGPGGGGGGGGADKKPQKGPPSTRSSNDSKSCKPASSTLAEVANIAEDVSTAASTVSLASGAAALFTSETVVGGLTFGGISAIAGGVSLAATGVAFVANYSAGRYGNAAVNVFSAAVSIGTGTGAKALPGGAQLAREAAGELMSDAAASICPG